MNIPPKYEDVVVKLGEALGREAEVCRLYDSLVNRSNREREASEMREAALREEASCLKAVLNGMEFKQVDDMVSDGVDACLFLGQESARIIKGIQAERDALREELAKFKAGCVDLSSQVRELEHKMDYYKGEGMRADDLQQRLTVAEQILQETSKAILRHQAEQPMSKRLSGLLTKARASVDRHLKGAALKPAEGGGDDS